MDYTFRTEFGFDTPRASELLKAVTGGEYITPEWVADGLVADFVMGVFSFKSELSLVELKRRMWNLVNKDPEFVDLHRCVQTLTEGLEPNELWYLEEVA